MSTCFRHEACLYDGPDDFVGATLPFVREGLEADDAVLVVVDRDRAGRLRDALDGDAGAVAFADMAEVGHNPARIIPAWVAFVEASRAEGRTPRGIGEPIGPHRSDDELRECHLHESLLNAVFGGGDPWALLCPYDTSALADDVLVEAMRTHPFVDRARSPLHRPPSPDDLSAPLPPAPPSAGELAFDLRTIRAVRERVAAVAALAGLAATHVEDVVVAVNEVATNSTRHGGGSGVLRDWTEGATLVVEVADAGHIADPLVGRLAPTIEQVGGRGIWMCNQIADLVQVRSTEAGTTVRLRFAPHHP